MTKSRIAIEDLPKDRSLSAKELRRIGGGSGPVVAGSGRAVSRNGLPAKIDRDRLWDWWE